MYKIDLKAFRKANKLTQVELAGILGVSRSFVGQIECGASKLPEGYLQTLLANNDYDTSMLVTDNSTNISAKASGNGTAKVNIDNSVKTVADTSSDALLKAEIEYLKKEVESLKTQLAKAEDDKQKYLDLLQRLMK